MKRRNKTKKPKYGMNRKFLVQKATSDNRDEYSQEDSDEDNNADSLWEEVDSLGEELKERKYYSIKDGIVIDNIPHNKSFEVCRILGLINLDGIEILLEAGVLDKRFLDSGTNTSASSIRKDVLRIRYSASSIVIKAKEIHKIAIIAPDANVSYIENFKVAHSFKVKMPQILEGVIKCNNPNCVSVYASNVNPKFVLKEGLCEYECYFCKSQLKKEDYSLMK